MRRIAPRAAAWLLLLTVSTSPQIFVSEAHAAPKAKRSASKGAKKTVALGEFSGPKGSGVRTWAEDTLKGSDTIAVVSNESVSQKSVAADYAAVAKKTGAAAVVVGRVDLQKKVGWSLNLWVYNGSTGKLIDKVRIGGGLLPGLKNKIEDNLEKLLAGPLAKAEGGKGGAVAAPAEEKDPEQEKLDAAKAASEEKAAAENPPTIVLEEEPEADAPAGGDGGGGAEEVAVPGAVGPSALDVRMALRIYKRDFAFTQTLAEFYPGVYQPLLVHTTAPSPMFSAHVNAYPGALFTDGFLAHLGLLGGYEVGFLSKTTLLDKQLTQEHINRYFGARYRIMFGDHYVSPMFAIGKHSFVIENDLIEIYDSRPGSARIYEADALPDTQYSYRDLGLDVRFDFGTISLGAHGAYRFVTDTGGLQAASADVDTKPYDTWFPNARGFGVTAGLYGGYALTDVIEFQVGGDFLRYSFDFNPLPQDVLGVPFERIAGGATDTYISGWLGVGVTFPGVPPVKAAASSEKADENFVEDEDDDDIEELE